MYDALFAADRAKRALMKSLSSPLPSIRIIMTGMRFLRIDDRLPRTGGSLCNLLN
jgi:hypothetical protein